MPVANVIKFLTDDIKFLKRGKRAAKTNKDDGTATPLDKLMWQAWMDYYDQLIPIDEKLKTALAGGNKKKPKRWLKRENEAIDKVIKAINDEIGKKGQLPGTIRHLKGLRRLMKIEKSSNEKLRSEIT